MLGKVSIKKGYLDMKTEEIESQVTHVSSILKALIITNSDSLSFLRALTKVIKSEELSIQESVDIGFLLRECETQLDEMRKDFKAHKEAIGKQTCFRLAQLDEEKVKGELAIGSIKVSHFSKLPHPEREPEKFSKLCKFFNINIDNVPLGSVRFHWPVIQEYVTKCMQEGVELPHELSDVNVKLEMTYRRRV